jgi:hypothetical protein
MVVSLFSKTNPDVDTLMQQRNIPALIRALQSKDFDIQTRAAQALGTLGPDAMDELLIAVNTRHRDVRLGIIEALSVIKDSRAVPSLIRMLHVESNEVRWVAAIALGEINDPETIPPLITALRDPDKYVRYGAAFALAKTGWKPETPDEKAWYFIGMQEWEAVQEIGAAAVPALSRILQDRDSSVRINAIGILGGIGDESAVPALIRALGDENSAVRWKAVLASSKCGIPALYLPRGLSKRPRVQKNPLIAGFLNFMLPGLGYGYLGKWWGVMIFQIDITITVWLFKYEGEGSTYGLLFPVYIILALHAWYLARKMPEL